MHPLSTLDYAIIIGYLALSLVLGAVMTRKANSGLENYFLGGRTLPWYLLGISGMANWFDLTGTMIITSFLYMLGPRGLFIEFRGGACLVLAFMLAYTGKWHRRSGCMTGAEWMTYRFGPGPAAEGARLLTAAANLVVTIMIVAYFVRGASLFLGMFFPWPPLDTTLVLVGISTVYAMSSGFYGVVLTDLVQGIIIIASCGIVSVMAWRLVPSSASLSATAAQVTGNPSWIDSHPAWRTPMPPGYEAYSPLVMMAAFYLARNVIGGLGTGAEPRYFGARSDRDCGLQSLLQGIMVMFRWPLMIGFAVMGIYLVHGLFPDPGTVRAAAALVHAQFPRIGAARWHDLTSGIVNSPAGCPPQLLHDLRALLGPGWRDKLPLVGIQGTVNPEEILPAVLLNSVPAGLKGFIVVAMVAAMMSCKNGLVNISSGYFVRDLYQNFLRPAASNRELMLASHLSTLGIVAAAFYIGVATTSINNIWGWLVMSLTAGQLAPQALRLYWWRCNAWGVMAGTLFGVFGSIAQRVLAPAMPETTQFLLMSALSFAGTIGGSLLTAPSPEPVLREFYRTTRPFGWWKPFRGLFQGPERAAVDRENLRDAATVPVALVWQVTLFLLPMQAVIKARAAFWDTLPVFLAASAALYFLWWRPLMRAAN